MFRKKEAFNCVDADEMSSGREEVIAFDNMEKHGDVGKDNFGRVVALEGGMEGLEG